MIPIITVLLKVNTLGGFVVISISSTFLPVLSELKPKDVQPGSNPSLATVTRQFTAAQTGSGQVVRGTDGGGE